MSSNPVIKRKRISKRHGVWKPKGSPYFYCSFVVMGVRFNGPTRLANEQDAIAFSKRWKAAERKKMESHGAKTGRNMRFLAAVNRYVREYVKKNGKAPYRDHDLDWLVDQIGPDTRLSAFDTEMLNKAVEARGEMPRFGDPKHGLVKQGTILQSVLRPLSAIMHKARDEWGVPIVNLPKMTGLFVPFARKRELSIREQIELIPECGDYAWLVEFCIRSGFRRENALIRRSDVFLEEGVIRVIAKKEKLHEIKITPAIERILKANMNNPTEFVFTYEARTKRGVERRPITASGFASAFKAAAKRAGIVDLVIHDLRRTAGARMYRATGNIGAVSKFLGHANVLITQKHYVHITINDVELAMLTTEAATEVLYEKALANMAVH